MALARKPAAEVDDLLPRRAPSGGLWPFKLRFAVSPQGGAPIGLLYELPLGWPLIENKLVIIWFYQSYMYYDWLLFKGSCNGGN